MQRIARLDRKTSFICVMIALLASLGMSARLLPDLRGGGLYNPDSFMRLVRLRDMLDSGVEVHGVGRDGSGHGTILHWSHLLDTLIYLLMQPFRLFLNPDGALHAAGLIVGPLNIIAVAIAIIWAAAPFAERKYLWFGAILPALSPAIGGYAVAGVVHHHTAIVTVAVTAWGWAARIIAYPPAKPHAALALGAWTGLGVWLTPETVPLTMMAFGALWLAWVLSPNRNELAGSIGLTGGAFALVTLLALLVDPPATGIGAVEIDRISALFAGLALAVAVTGLGLWASHGRVSRPATRIAASIAIGAVCCGIWAATFHGVIFQDDMLLDERQREAMFGQVQEMQPVTGVLAALHFVLTGALALILAAVLAVSRRSLLLAYVAACLAGMLAVAMMHLRFAAYPEAAGSIAFPIVITLAGQVTQGWREIGQSMVRITLVLLFIQVPFLSPMLDPRVVVQAVANATAPPCRAVDAAAMLAAHPGEVVLADVNDTPELLYRTPVKTVGSLYHRDLPAFARLRAAWRTAPSETVPVEIDAAEVSLVLGCKSPDRHGLVESVRGTTLSDQLRTEQPPPWLVRIDENPSSGQTLYEVVRGRRPAETASVR